jgi:hypothetical protein
MPSGQSGSAALAPTGSRLTKPCSKPLRPSPSPQPPQQEALLSRLATATAPRLRDLQPRAVAALALALSGAGFYSSDWFEAAAAAAAADLASGGAVAAAEAPLVATVLAAGFSAAGHYDEALFAALADAVRGAQGAGCRVMGKRARTLPARAPST